MKHEPSSASDSGVRNILDLMTAFADVRARAMFGGHGLYRDGLMFALLADGALYFKVDEQSRPIFTQRDLRAFSFTAKGRTVQLSYHEAPPQALEDQACMAEWCRLAWEAALRAKAKGGTKATTRRSPRGSAIPIPSADPVRESEEGIGADWLDALPNLGPHSVEWLCAAGITNPQRLRELGAVRAFVRVRARNPAVSLNLLWALEGALTGRRWQEVAETDRASLLMALEDVLRHA